MYSWLFVPVLSPCDWMWEDSTLFQALSIPFESLVKGKKKNNDTTKLKHKIMVTADEIDARQLFSQRNNGLDLRVHYNVQEERTWQSLQTRPVNQNHFTQLNCRQKIISHWKKKKKSLKRLLIMDLGLRWHLRSRPDFPGDLPFLLIKIR